MDRITMPAALLARRLLSSLWCQKQVVIGHRGRCPGSPASGFLGACAGWLAAASAGMRLFLNDQPDLYRPDEFEYKRCLDPNS
jgi:hypothetical protein